MLTLFYFRCRPPWRDPRFGFGFIDNNGSAYSLDTVETAVSPGLRLKYTNRSGESLAYQVRKSKNSLSKKGTKYTLLTQTLGLEVLRVYLCIHVSKLIH